MRDGATLVSILSPGSLVIDLTMNRCDTVHSAAQRLADRGIDFLDAPVSGGHAGAEQGTLNVPTPLGSACLHLAQQVTGRGWDARDSWTVLTLQEDAAGAGVRSAREQLHQARRRNPIRCLTVAAGGSLMPHYPDGIP